MCLLIEFSFNSNYPSLAPKQPRSTSPDLSTHLPKKTSHNSIKNSHAMQQQAKPPPLPSNLPFELAQQLDAHTKFQKKGVTPNQIKLKAKNNASKRTSEDNESASIINNCDFSVNSIKPIETVTTENILLPESPRFFLTNATNKSKTVTTTTTTTTTTTDSSMSSSLSSSNSSFAFPCPTTTSKSQPVANSLNQINSYLSNLSPKLHSEAHTPRQNSERIKLTCMLNGYISHGSDEQFNSQSTSNITNENNNIKKDNGSDSPRLGLNNSYRNDSSYSYSSNRDSMNKSADILNCERFYDLKKKVWLFFDSEQFKWLREVLFQFEFVHDTCTHI